MAKEVQVEFPCVTRHCLLHAVHVLAPNGIHHVLPKSGSHKIERFCEELSELTKAKQKRKKAVSLPEPPLLLSIEIHKFYSGATTIEDFTILIEQKLLSATEGSIDLDALQRLCWSHYEVDKRSVITFPKWLSPECTYRLWLIFNTVHDHNLVTPIPRKTVNEVMKRLIELCGYTWNDSYKYTRQEEVEFPEYVEAITDYFDQLQLETSLTCEVIADLVDEVVSGVIKKGYLCKKGHKRHNVKRRWFILQRTVLRYFVNRDATNLKGKLVLNGRTEVDSLPDKGSKKYMFRVTCGHTGTPFQIYADDQRSKHEWILAIKRAIALAKIMEGGSSVNEAGLTQSIAGLYLLKYGTDTPTLSRQDSEINKMKYYTSPRQFQKLTDADMAVREDMPRNLSVSSNEDEPQDDYTPMHPVAGQDISSDSSDSDNDQGYIEMGPKLGTVDEQEEDALAGIEYEPDHKPPSGGESSLKGGSPIISPSGGKSFLKEDSPTSPMEKPLVILESGPEDTPPPVAERPLSSFHYDEINIGNQLIPIRHNSDVDGSYIHFTRDSLDSGWGSQASASDAEAPAPVNREDREVASVTQKKPADTMDVRRDLLQQPTPSTGASYLTIMPGRKGTLPTLEKSQLPRKNRSPGSLAVHSPPREHSPPVVSPTGSRVPPSRDSHGATPPVPPPRVSPRHHRPLVGQGSFPNENPPPVPSHRSHRFSSPPDSFGMVRSASQSDCLDEDTHEDVSRFSKSVAVGHI